MRAVNPEADFETASNPEFLREGEAVKDFMSPDRIVIGVASQRSAAVLQRLYRPQQPAGVPLEVTGPETAELTKYARSAERRVGNAGVCTLRSRWWPGY